MRRVFISDASVRAAMDAAADPAGGAQLLPRGPQVLVGGRRFFLDLAQVQASDRPRVIQDAARQIDGMRPEGDLYLALQGTDEGLLRRTHRLNVNAVTPAASAALDRLQGTLQAGGVSVPLRGAVRMPVGVVQMTAVNVSRLPGELHRRGVGARILGAMAPGFELVSEHVPIDAGTGLLLGDKLVLWARPPAGPAALEPAEVVFGSIADIRVFVDGVSAGLFRNRWLHGRA